MNDSEIPLTKQQLWLVSIGAMLAKQNNYEQFQLSLAAADDEKRINEAKQTIARDWGIRSKDDLYGSFAFLEDGGHGIDYLQIAQQWLPLSPDKREAMLARANDDELESKVRLVVTHHMALRDCGIYAWDVGRHAYLIRDGYYIGLIDKEEAWQRLLVLAHRVQPRFESWAHFGLSYAVGRAFWAAGPLSEHYCNEMFSTLNKIVMDEEHPWNQLEWQLPLPPIEAQ